MYCILKAMERILIALLWYKFPLVCMDSNDIFRQDIGDKMEIGLSDKGYKTVELNCGSESMVVNLETDDEFLGVVYTRGSFYDKKPPCFSETGDKRWQTSFKMKIPFDSCNTKQENNIYSNVLILQHDKELILPGDAAFNLECDFSKPRDVIVTADLQRYKNNYCIH
ncbi:cuticlin-1 [Anoplophora glabripennis]|uniref:cuticlin-1 n=1 Tax=Anoplophora glabripennis TaxID=217634 RepID=UPI0008759817|nr:cuticlin-1 [Anoplophora glabripennis]